MTKKKVLELATCKWVELHQNIVVTGMTGVGKTYLGCALAQQACRRDLNEIMDDRYGLRSTVSTSQLPTEKWHDHLGADHRRCHL